MLFFGVKCKSCILKSVHSFVAILTCAYFTAIDITIIDKIDVTDVST